MGAATTLTIVVHRVRASRRRVVARTTGARRRVPPTKIITFASLYARASLDAFVASSRSTDARDRERQRALASRDARAGRDARARGARASRRFVCIIFVIMGRDDPFLGHVRAARARARDPTATSDALEDDAWRRDLEATAIATIATAGGKGCGKTALTRRCFAEFRRGDDASAPTPREWRATPTIGMDFGAMTCECVGANGERRRVRARFLDPSGAREHAACRAEAYAAADAVVVVLDPARADASVESIEATLAEIADARATRHDEPNEDAAARRAAAPVRVVFARNLRAPPSRRGARAPPRDVTALELTARVTAAARAALARHPTAFRLLAPARVSASAERSAAERRDDVLALRDAELGGDATSNASTRHHRRVTVDADANVVANVDVADGRGVLALFSAILTLPPYSNPP